MLVKTGSTYGGVIESVKNYARALESVGKQAEILCWQSFFKRFDIGHSHASNVIKRCIWVILSRILAKKAFFTIHGNVFSQSNFFNKISLLIATKIIVLNQDMYDKLSSSKYSFKTAKLTPLLLEGIEPKVASKTFYFKKEENKEYLLLYAYRKTTINGKEVYGIQFILENLHLLDAKHVVVFVDPSRGYAEDVNSGDYKNLIYIPNSVDFKQLLDQVNIYIRPTSSDGNSVSIQEALLKGIPVVASDSVDRFFPEVFLYKHLEFNDLKRSLKNTTKQSKKIRLSSVQSYINLCKNI
jgi:hypothetical protein